MEFHHNSSLFASLPPPPPQSGLVCPICFLPAARLVRDHDHETGLIRGGLCDPCNGKLGLLESHPERFHLRTKGRKARAWRRWVMDNAERIREHLQQTTGEVYERKRSAVRNSKESGLARLTSTRSGAEESRANTRTSPSVDRPNIGGFRSPDPSPNPCFPDRDTWAKEIIRRAREGWP